MESCFGTIKTELEMTEYKSMQEAEKELAEYFAYYNRDRKHSGIGYQSPIQFENNQRVHSKRNRSRVGEWAGLFKPL